MEDMFPGVEWGVSPGGEPVAVAELYRRVSLGGLTELLAHEINNVFTGLSGYAQMVQGSPRETVFRRAAGAFLEGTERMQDLVGALLRLAREPLLPLSPTSPLDGGRLVSTLLGRHLEKRNIALIFKGEGEWAVRASLPLLALVVLTGVLDARQRLLARDETGWIQVEAVSSGPEASLVIRDSDPSGFSGMEVPADSLDFQRKLARPFLLSASRLLEGEVRWPSGPGEPLSFSVPVAIPPV